MRSPYLIGLSVFVVLLATVTTFLYFEQARLVDATFPDETRQTQVFSAIDVTVQTLTIFIQVFFTGRLTKRLGVTVLLTAVPVLMVLGLGALALVATTRSTTRRARVLAPTRTARPPRRAAG